jgi:hypothetical protein
LLLLLLLAADAAVAVKSIPPKPVLAFWQISDHVILIMFGAS